MTHYKENLIYRNFDANGSPLPEKEEQSVCSICQEPYEKHLSKTFIQSLDLECDTNSYR
jgi:hypothetical protein